VWPCRYRRKLGDGLHLLFNSDGKSANDYLIKLSKCAEWYHLDKAICIIKKYGEANHDLRRVALHLDAVRFLVQERHNIQAGQSDFPTGTLEEAWLQILRCLIEHTFVRTGELTHQAVLVCSSFIAAISCYFEMRSQLNRNLSSIS